MRRKQISIHFSRSALSHRYLRYISWISWNGGHRPQPSTSWVFSTRAATAHRFSRRCLYPKAAIAVLLLLPLTTTLQSFPKKKKNNLFPFLSHTSRVSLLLCCSARSHSHVPPATHLRPVCLLPLTSPSAALPQTKNAGPQHCAANPLTTFVKRAQKSVDFSLKKNTRRHARLSRSCFGRNRRPAFTTALFPFSFFTKEKKKENRSKFSRFEYIARTHFVRPHDVRDWPVAPRPLKFM